MVHTVSESKAHSMRVVIADQLQQQLGRSLGVSAQRSNPKQLLMTAEEAVQALRHSFYATDAHVFYAEDRPLVNKRAFEDKSNQILREISAQSIVKSICSTRALLSEVTNSMPAPDSLRERCLAIAGGYRIIALSWSNDVAVRACDSAEEAIRAAESFRVLSAEMESLLEVIEDTMGNEYSQYVRMAISQVHENYTHIHRITDVSDLLGLNAEYFCRIFKAETGTTFNTFLTSFRMKLACELLKKTDMKIIDIAQKVGYSNLSYFSRVFKGYTSMNPFRYRETQTEKSFRIFDLMGIKSAWSWHSRNQKKHRSLYQQQNKIQAPDAYARTLKLSRASNCADVSPSQQLQQNHRAQPALH